MNPFIQQIKNFCCLDVNCDSELEKLAIRFIHQLSVKSCWASNTCDTLLFGQRTEILKLPCKKCDHCGDVIYFTPFYYVSGADLSDVEISVFYYDGLDYTEQQLDQSEYKLNTETKEIAIKLPSGDCCCDTKKEMRITYNSGFHVLPECILPIICDLMHELKERNFCGCGNCETCQYTGVLDPQGKIIDEKEKYIDELNAWINSAEFMTLDQISLCKKFKPILGADSCAWY